MSVLAARVSRDLIISPSLPDKATDAQGGGESISITTEAGLDPRPGISECLYKGQVTQATGFIILIMFSIVNFFSTPSLMSLNGMFFDQMTTLNPKLIAFKINLSVPKYHAS